MGNISLGFGSSFPCLTTFTCLPFYLNKAYSSSKCQILTTPNSIEQKNNVSISFLFISCCVFLLKTSLSFKLQFTKLKLHNQTFHYAYMNLISFLFFSFIPLLQLNCNNQDQTFTHAISNNYPNYLYYMATTSIPMIY